MKAPRQLRPFVFAAVLVTALAMLTATQGASAQVGQKVTAIEIEGNVNVPAETILGVVSLKVGDVLTSEAVAADAKAIGGLGYFASVQPQAVPYLGGVKVIYQVVENPKLSAIQFTGNTMVPSQDLEILMSSKIGEVININTLKADFERIGKFYYNAGYSVSIEPSVSADGRLTIKIVEWRVAEVKVAGNKKTKESVIRREITTKPGDVLNVKKLQEDQRRIYNLGAFQDVYVKIDPVPSKPEYVVTFEVSERKTGTATAGVAWSPSEGLVGRVEIAEENLFGNLQRLNLRAEFGSGRNNYELGFYEPWLDKNRTSIGFNIYSLTTERKIEDAGAPGDGYWNYTQSRRGGNVTLGRPLDLNTRASLTLKIEDTRNVTDEQNWTPPEGGSTRSLTLSLRNDTRDDFMDPNKGRVLRGSVEYAGGFLGGDNDFIKYSADGSAYYEVRPGHVLAFHLGVGFANTDLPDQELFRLGGGETIRGYRYSELSGDRMAVFNAEYRFDIAKSLQGVVFVDAGKTWDHSEAFSLDGGKVGYGVGVRIMVPALGIMRIDYGIGESGGQTYFSFGQSF